MGRVIPEQLPEADINVMGRSLLRLVEAYYDDPVNKAEYERWLADQDGGQSDG